MEKDEKIKIALEELYKWGKHIDNFFWQISALLIGGTSYIYIKIIKKISSADFNKNEDEWILYIDVIIFFLWLMFMFFMKYISLKQLTIRKNIEKIEENFFKFGESDESIDILPNEIANSFEEDEDIKLEIYKPFFKTIMGKKLICKWNYFDFMLFITFLVWFLSVIILIVYFVK